MKPLSRRGVRSPNSSLRENNRPATSAEESYVAGLLAADGSIQKDKGLAITLQLSSRGLLESLAEHFNRPGPYLNRRKPPRKDELQLYFRHLPYAWKKSFPGCSHPDEYVRGLFDGDGSISWIRGYPMAEFYYDTSEQWIGDFYKSYVEGLGLSHREHTGGSHCPTNRRVVIRGTHFTKLFLSQLYGNVESFALGDKLDRAQRILT